MNRRYIPLFAAALLGINSCGIKIGNSTVGDYVGTSSTHLVNAGNDLYSAATLSEKDEDDLGQSVGVSVTNTYKVLKDEALTRYVTLVGLTVADTCPRPDIEYVFGILDTDEVNAFSGPHGYVFITRGALAHMQDEAELAGVLGHEMSHVFLHHGREQVRLNDIGAAGSELAQGAPASDKWAAFADKGIDAITTKGYSQKLEFEADESSVKIIATAGYDTMSYLHFLQRLAKLQSVDKTAMSTHPDASDRVDRVRQQLDDMPVGGVSLEARFRANVPFALPATEPTTPTTEPSSPAATQP